MSDHHSHGVSRSGFGQTSDSLTYRASGVDVDANNEANERIKAQVLRTHDDRVLTRPGLFGGAVSLKAAPDAPLSLVGAIESEPEGGSEGCARRLVGRLRERLGAETLPLAFLDYLAAGRLEPTRAARLVGDFAEALLSSPRAVLIGGETAEMPGTLREGRWEVVGALFGTRAFGAGDASGSAADLAAARRMAHPALVFSMDGVGTKTRVAVAAGRTSGLGVDIIHHSLNDILCQGARGVAMSFYLGCHAREEKLVGPLCLGLERRCGELGLSVLDLRVREKPEVYRPGEIDLCAAVAGLVDADHLIQGASVSSGDVLLGLASSGLHTNGYSLARKALLERGAYSLDQRLPGLRATLAEALLEPHRCYASAVLPLLAEPGQVRAVAHITGGGLPDNLARVLPAGLEAQIRLSSWEPPPLFRLIQAAGDVPEQETAARGMYETFNMGIGLVLVVAPDSSDSVRRRLQQAGQVVSQIGTVVPASGLEPGPRVRLQP